MISYEYFEQVMTELKAAEDFENEVAQAIENLRKKKVKHLPTDFMGEQTLIIAHAELVIELMAKLFAKGDEKLEEIIVEIISWYIWDTDWGKENTEVEYPDGTKKNIVTFKDCYDDVIYSINNRQN